MGRSSERRRLAREAQKQKEQEAADARQAWVRDRIRDALLSLGLIIAAFVTAVSFWDSQRELAIASVAAAIALSAAGELIVLKLRAVWPLGVASIALALAGALYWYVGPALPPESETHGWLRASDDPTTYGCPPPITLPIPSNYVTLSVGGNTIFLPPEQRNFSVLSYHGNPVLSFHRELDSEYAYISAYLRDKNGEPVAFVERNEFRVNPSRSYIERSLDLSELWIKAYDGKELLYVRFLNPRTFFVRGHFWVDKGWELSISKDKGVVLRNPTGSATQLGSCGGGLQVTADGKLLFG